MLTSPELPLYWRVCSCVELCIHWSLLRWCLTGAYMLCRGRLLTCSLMELSPPGEPLWSGLFGNGFTTVGGACSSPVAFIICRRWFLCGAKHSLSPLASLVDANHVKACCSPTPHTWGSVLNDSPGRLLWLALRSISHGALPLCDASFPVSFSLCPSFYSHVITTECTLWMMWGGTFCLFSSLHLIQWTF